MSAALCVAFLVLAAGVRPRADVLASLGLGLFMTGALFAAIAALGPKYRPTPLLTPAMAGTIAAVLATVAMAAGNRQPSEVAHASRPMATPPAAADPVAKVQPVVTLVPVRQVLPKEEPATVPERVPLPERADPIGAAFDFPEVEVEPEANAASEIPATRGEAADAALETIFPPIPRRPPRPWEPFGPLVFVEDPFDPSSDPPPNAVTASAMAIPPLPRSRPCGADGPPCP